MTHKAIKIPRCPRALQVFNQSGGPLDHMTKDGVGLARRGGILAVAHYWALPGVPEAVPGIWDVASSNAGGSLCLVLGKSPGAGLRASEPSSLHRTEAACWSAPSWAGWAEPSMAESVDRREGGNTR